MNDKRLLGQFFTITNPFELNVFLKWLKKIDNVENEIFIEPFAGANNIVEMIESISNDKFNKWVCFDISPAENNKVPECEVVKRDTIKDFPKGYKVAITNPPYLAKNSATRRELEYLGEPYDDLYKKALEVMLDNCEYVGAIIPESYITSGLFHERLDTVISLTCKMFDDTEVPVCLALFSPATLSTDFKIYRQDKYIGNYEDLKQYIFTSRYKRNEWKMNDRKGNLGIICVDNQKENSIRFVKGALIDEEEIKSTSRAKTRVSGLPKEIDIDEFINRCNEKIEKYRNKTCDVFLTSFKGLRSDGKYRRRLDFNTAKLIMSTVLEEMEGEKNEGD